MEWHEVQARYQGDVASAEKKAATLRNTLISKAKALRDQALAELEVTENDQLTNAAIDQE